MTQAGSPRLVVTSYTETYTPVGPGAASRGSLAFDAAARHAKLPAKYGVEAAPCGLQLLNENYVDSGTSTEQGHLP